MANSDKNIRIQPNRNSTLFPKITFTGQSNNPITLNVLDDNSISFEGSAGQLFSINNNLSSGYIFSVNDISGLPSFRINADGTVGIAEFYGNVGIGITNPSYKFHARGDSYFSSTGNTALLLLSGTGGTIIASNSVNITLTDPARKGLVINAANLQTANIFEWYADGGVGGGYSLAGTIRPSGQVHLGSPGLTMSNGGSALLGLQGRGSSEGLAIRGYNSNSTNPLFEIQGNPGNQLFGIYGDGGVNAPRINVTNGTASTATNNGALIVTGGVGIGGSVNIGSALTVYGTTRLNSSLFNIPPTSSIGGTSGSANFGTYWTGYQVENGYLIYGRQTVGGSILLVEPSTGTQVGGTTNIFAEALKHFKWGKDKYVVLASTGNSVLYSTSPVGAGSSWYYATLPTTASWQRLEYGNNRFVAIATGSTAVYSYDGITWSLSSLPASIAWTDIKYGNGVFVAGAASTVAYSYDGIEWTIASNNVPAQNLTYGNGLFFANNTGNTASYSADGINWTNVTLPSDTHRGSTYGNGVFFNIGASSSNYISSDLINWTSTANGVGSLSVPNSPWYVNNTFYWNNNATSFGAFVAGPSGTLDLNPRFTGDINNVEIGNVKPAAAEFTTLAASGPVRFVSGLASTNFRNGSVVITGGVGIGGTLNVNNIGIGYTGIPYSPSIAFIGTTGDPIRLNVLSNNTLSFEGRSGQLFSINNNLSSGWIFSVNDISGIPLFRANADATISMAEYAGNVGIGLSNPTFKFQVNGSASIGGTFLISSITASTAASNGALTVAGGVGIGGTLNANSVVTYNRLQNQSFSGTAIGTTGFPTTGKGTGHDRISFGNGLFVSNSSWGAYNASYSTDAVNWIGATLPVNQGYPVNFFGNGYFVLAATANTTVLYSTNGTSWSQVSIGNTETRTSGVYGNGKYVITGTGATYNYSSNLTTWSTGTLPLTADWRLAFGNGIFVGLGYGTNRLIYSYDGINWSIGNVSSSVGANWTKVKYGNGKFVVSNMSGWASVISVDGINWFGTSAPSGLNGNQISVEYGNGTYVINDDNNAYTFSIDGITWNTAYSTGGNFDAGGPVYGLNKFNLFGRYVEGPANTVTLDPKFTGEINNVRIGAITPASGDFTNLSSTGSANLVGTVNANNLNILSKVDQTPILGGFAGTTGWTSAVLLAGSDNNYALAFGNGLFVQIRRTTNHTSFSSDGKRWIASTMPFTGEWYDLAWGKDKFVAVAGVGTTGAYSGNGISWTPMNMPSNADGWYKITYADEKYVAISSTGSTAAYSSDGISWSTSSMIASTNWRDITYGNGTFIAVSGTGRSAVYSYDGINWNLFNLPSSSGGNYRYITYGNGLFVTPAYNTSAVDYSRDGINWSTINITSGLHLPTVYGNGMYATFNYSNVHYSYDGITWLVGNTIAATDWFAAEYGNNRFVATSINTQQVGSIDGPSNTLNLHPKFTGDIDNVRIGAKQPAAAEFTNLAAQQPVRFTANTPSTNTTNGALMVLGGVGIGGSLNIGSDVIINGGRESNSTSTGSLIVRGGVGITGGLYVSPFSSTGKGIVVASRASQSGNLFELQNSSLSTITSFNFLGDLNITSSTANTSATTGSIVTSGGVGIGGSVTINSLSQSTSTTNGALKVSGGVGISGNVNVGGSLNFSSSIFGGVSTSIVPTMTFIGQANDPITLSVLSDNSLSFDGSSGQLFSINNNLSTGWIFSISDISGLPLFRTNADGTVSMGEFGGNVGIGLTNPTFKLQVAGRASIGNTLFVTGNAHFGSTAYFDNYQSIYSPVVTITENFPGDTGLQIKNNSTDSNARSGIQIYNDFNESLGLYLGSSNFSGIGVTSTAYLETFKYLEVSAGDGMRFRTLDGDAIIVGGAGVSVSPTTESTSTTTGSLIISGGAGIAKSVNIGGFLSSKPAYATVGLAADETILTGADTVLIMTDISDPNSWWTGTAAIGVSHIFKPNIQGVYFVALQVHFKTGSGTGQMNIQARKNTTTFSLSQDVVNTTEGRTLNLTGAVSLNGSTDYIDFTAYTSATTSQDITGEGNRSFTQATIYKLF